MAALLTKRIALLTTSFFLFLMALPLISIGTTSGRPSLLWIGLAALGVAGLIPPLQRLLGKPKPQVPGDGRNENAG